MTNITLHGEIAEAVGRKDWKLEVNSVAEAMRAIHVQSKNKLYNYLIESSKKNIEYKILVNERELLQEKEISLDNIYELSNSEIIMNNKNLRSIDIVPIIAGAGSGGGGGSSTKGIIAIVLAVVLIATGVGAAGGTGILAGMSTGLIIGGAALAITGITLLLMQPPKFEDFRTINDGKSSTKPSYLFDGPTNILGEGGPVPIGYGRMLIGSQTVEVTINNKELPNSVTSEDIKNSIA